MLLDSSKKLITSNSIPAITRKNKVWIPYQTLNYIKTCKKEVLHEKYPLSSTP